MNYGFGAGKLPHVIKFVEYVVEARLVSALVTILVSLRVRASVSQRLILQVTIFVGVQNFSLGHWTAHHLHRPAVAVVLAVIIALFTFVVFKLSLHAFEILCLLRFLRDLWGKKVINFKCLLCLRVLADRAISRVRNARLFLLGVTMVSWGLWLAEAVVQLRIRIFPA